MVQSTWKGLAVTVWLCTSTCWMTVTLSSVWVRWEMTDKGACIFSSEPPHEHWISRNILELPRCQWEKTLTANPNTSSYKKLSKWKMFLIFLNRYRQMFVFLQQQTNFAEVFTQPCNTLNVDSLSTCLSVTIAILYQWGITRTKA